MQARPWFASYHRYGIPAELPAPEHPNVTVMLERAMQRYSTRCAFHSLGQSLSYADVDRLSRDFAAWLQAQGVRHGDRVAVMCPNILAFPIAMLGIIRAGAVQVNVNPMYTPRELEHQLNDAGVDTIVIYTGATPTLAEVMAHTGIRRIVSAGLVLDPADPAAQQIVSPPLDARLEGVVTFSEALQAGAALPFTSVEQAANDLIFLQYTGGTTGLSKGAALSHGNLVANCTQFGAFMAAALRPGQEVVVTAIPLYHIFALMVNFITYFAVGAENWLVANPRDMDSFVNTLKAARPTVFTGVNTLYAGLTMHPQLGEVDWSRLRLAAGGGAAVIRTVSERWEAITGQMIREGYGLSETSPVLSFNPQAVQEFTGTTGMPLPGTDIKLLGDDGNEVAPGQSGEVCAKGPQVMSGYWNQPQANRSAFTPDGYFRTGDIGVITPEGCLKIVDRKKDMIIVSAFNVYPNEVEAVAAGCQGVAECACVGVPDDKTGEAVALFVVRRSGIELSEAQLIEHCRKELAAYKIPRIVHFVEALPKSAVGKILRRELRQL